MSERGRDENASGSISKLLSSHVSGESDRERKRRSRKLYHEFNSDNDSEPSLPRQFVINKPD